MSKELTKQIINTLIDNGLCKITVTDKYIEIDLDRSLIIKSSGHTILYSKDGKLVTSHKETHINPYVNRDSVEPVNMEFLKDNIEDMNIDKVTEKVLPREEHKCNK